MVDRFLLVTGRGKGGFAFPFRLMDSAITESFGARDNAGPRDQEVSWTDRQC